MLEVGDKSTGRVGYGGRGGCDDGRGAARDRRGAGRRQEGEAGPGAATSHTGSGAAPPSSPPAPCRRHRGRRRGRLRRPRRHGRLHRPAHRHHPHVRILDLDLPAGRHRLRGHRDHPVLDGGHPRRSLDPGRVAGHDRTGQHHQVVRTSPSGAIARRAGRPRRGSTRPNAREPSLGQRSGPGRGRGQEQHRQHPADPDRSEIPERVGRVSRRGSSRASPRSIATLTPTSTPRSCPRLPHATGRAEANGLTDQGGPATSVR